MIFQVISNYLFITLEACFKKMKQNGSNIQNNCFQLTVEIFDSVFFFLAPGAYDVENADKKIHESSPAYSLGVKYKEQKPEDIPGKSSFIF